jgi:colicin import membrane protein
MTFRLPHLFAALALHVALLGVLAGGLQCSVKPVTPQIITAVLLDPSRQEVAQRKRQEQRQSELERQRLEADARRKAEAQKAAEARKKKDAEVLRLRQAAEKKAAEARAAEKKKAGETARRQAEEQARVEKAMQDEASRLQAERAATAQAEAARLDRIGEWAHALVRHVQANYRKPPSAPDDFACQVRMQLLPDGTVTNAKIVKSCGSVLLDRAVEDAVYRSSPMPRPADPSVFDRDLTINFTP